MKTEKPINWPRYLTQIETAVKQAHDLLERRKVGEALEQLEQIGVLATRSRWDVMYRAGILPLAEVQE